MRINLPGLIKEKQRSGGTRWRVRVKGQKHKRILLPVGPDHPDFNRLYTAARNGQATEASRHERPDVIPGSFEWLTQRFIDHMERQVAAGQLDASTLKQRAAFYDRLIARFGQKVMAMPRHKVLEIRDEMVGTPGAADNMVKSIRALFKWAVDRGHVQENPAAGIGRISRGSGATPWTPADVDQFRKFHAPGSMAHFALTLFMFSGCRIGDAVLLGRSNVADGMLHWQPTKRGSAAVSVPILPPLEAAIRSQTVVGPTFLLTALGKPFASSTAFGNRFRKWCAEAELQGRSPHGIRKALAELLAERGLSQFHIMAVLGHTQAKTSEVYTRGVDRTRLATEAFAAMKSIEW
ncbi:MAG: tyrosine-type recombinase/integrase [Rhodobacter sp.]|nr:tyrosine-type recombinase/integrase [Rhodobacter sp.]